MPVALHAEKGEHVKLDLVWDMNPKAGIYTNKNTGVSFTQNIAGFRAITPILFRRMGSPVLSIGGTDE